jgi:hypothetical protein
MALFNAVAGLAEELASTPNRLSRRAAIARKGPNGSVLVELHFGERGFDLLGGHVGSLAEVAQGVDAGQFDEEIGDQVEVAIGVVDEDVHGGVQVQGTVQEAGSPEAAVNQDSLCALGDQVAAPDMLGVSPQDCRVAGLRISPLFQRALVDVDEPWPAAAGPRKQLAAHQLEVVAVVLDRDDLCDDARGEHRRTAATELQVGTVRILVQDGGEESGLARCHPDGNIAMPEPAAA